MSRRLLLHLVGLARLAPSGGNRQPLRYRLVRTRSECALVFPCLSWAAYLSDWPGPAVGERPPAYVVVLGDTAVATSFDLDAGIAVQTMALGAAEAGWGACILGAIDRDRLRKTLKVPRRYAILLVLALGRPAERVVLEPLEGTDVRYWRDGRGVHHVPKRRLRDLLIAGGPGGGRPRRGRIE